MNIYLNKLDIDFSKDSVTISFDDFNYFYGQMGSGKSSIARLIDYCLGGNLDMTPALQSEFNSVSLSLNINGVPLSLERARDSNQLIASWEKDKEKFQIVIPARKSDGVVIPDTDIEVLSDLLYHLAGYTPPKVRKSKTKEDTELKRLSFRNLLWYCYIDQENIDSTFFHLDKDAHIHKRLASRDVLRFIIGFHQEIVAELEMEVQEKNDKKRELRSAAEALKEAIKSAGVKSINQINEKINSLEEEKLTISEEISAIKENDLKDSIPHGIESLKEKARRLDKKIESIEQGIAEVNQQIEDDRNHLHEITMLSVKNKRSTSARAVLSGVDFKSCPRCAQELPERNTTICNLCGQEEVDSKDEVENQIDVVEQDADDRIKELKNLIKRYKDQLSNMKIQRRELKQRKKEIDTQINHQMEDYDSAYLSAILVREKRISEIDQEIEGLNELSRLPDKAQELLDKSVRLHSEEQKLREELKEAREKAESDTSNLEILQNLFLECLVESKLPGISDNDRVQISAPWFLPEVISPRSGELATTSFANLGSGGKKTLFKACFSLAIHLLSTRTEALLPTFLIIDSPMKNISERENREQFEGFHKFLYKLSQEELLDTQIILIDKEFCEPPEELNIEVNSRHMMPDSEENPPLIPYYRGH